MRCRTLAQGALVSIFALCHTALANAGPGAGDGGDVSLRGRVGLEAALRKLDGDLDEQVRGIEHLGSLGTPEAALALIGKVEAGLGAGTKGAKLRLLAVRALAPSVGLESVREFYSRDLFGATRPDVQSPLAAITRSTEALILAKSGEPKAYEALFQAVSLGGDARAAAVHALCAYPPASLTFLFERKDRWKPSVLEALAETGDLRAISPLRALLAKASDAQNYTLLRSLLLLGDLSVVPKLVDLASRDNERAPLICELLAELGLPESKAIAKKLVATPSQFDAGFQALSRSPDPGYVPVLLANMKGRSLEQRRSIATLFGLVGSAEALLKVRAWLSDEELLPYAALGLSLSSSGASARILESELLKASGNRRRWLARAAIARSYETTVVVPGLSSILETMSRSPDVQDRLVASFGRVILDNTSIEEELERGCKSRKDCDELIPALARAAIGVADERALLGTLEQRLLDGDTGAATTAASIALLTSNPRVPDPVLVAAVERGGASGPIAARSLASRLTPSTRVVVKSFLTGTDPSVRAHTAMGLGGAADAVAATLLSDAYAFEEEPDVRRAIVVALGKRTESVRDRILGLARDYDPAKTVRLAAGRALTSKVEEPDGFVRDRRCYWTRLESFAPSERALSPRAVRLQTAGGMAIPLVSDPDGTTMVCGGYADGVVVLPERIGATPRGVN